MCKIGSLIVNFTRELSMYFRERTTSTEDKDDSIMFNTLQSFLQFKYDLTNLENSKLFRRWLHKVTRIKEVQIEIPQEIEVLRNSHLGVLYVMPNLPKEKVLDEFFKINYMRNAVFGVPFMWMNYDLLNMEGFKDQKLFACKLIYRFFQIQKSLF